MYMMHLRLQSVAAAAYRMILRIVSYWNKDLFLKRTFTTESTFNSLQHDRRNRGEKKGGGVPPPYKNHIHNEIHI